MKLSELPTAIEGIQRTLRLFEKRIEDLESDKEYLEMTVKELKEDRSKSIPKRRSRSPSPDNDRRKQMEDRDARTVFISNVATEKYDHEQIKAIFQHYGDIYQVYYSKAEEGQTYTWATVEFYQLQSSEQCKADRETLYSDYKFQIRPYRRGGTKRYKK